MKSWIPYFAYGSNMDSRQFKERCPDSFLFGKACLPGWRVVLNGAGVATIVPDPATEVWGVVAWMTEGDLGILDRYEQLADNHYTRETMEVCLPEDYKFPCQIYIAVDNREGFPPRAGYLEKILHGAALYELPLEYQQRLAALRHGVSG